MAEPPPSKRRAVEPAVLHPPQQPESHLFGPPLPPPPPPPLPAAEAEAEADRSSSLSSSRGWADGSGGGVDSSRGPPTANTSTIEYAPAVGATMSWAGSAATRAVDMDTRATLSDLSTLIRNVQVRARIGGPSLRTDSGGGASER